MKQGTDNHLHKQAVAPEPPALQRKAGFDAKGRTARKGRAPWQQSPVLHVVCWSRWEQEIEKYAMTQQAPSFSSPHFLSPIPFLSLFVRRQTYFHGPFNQNGKLKASQREWTLHFAKDQILSCSKMKKKSNFISMMMAAIGSILPQNMIPRTSSL